MVTQAKFELKGLEEFMAKIQQAGIDIDVAAQNALMEGAPILRDEMRSLVNIDTSDLHDHIVIDGPFRDGNFNYVEVGVIHDASHTDAETAKKGNAQEYGWLSGGVFHPGKSYIRAGIDNKKSAVKRAIRESLKRQGFCE